MELSLILPYDWARSHRAPCPRLGRLFLYFAPVLLVFEGNVVKPSELELELLANNTEKSQQTEIWNLVLVEPPNDVSSKMARKKERFDCNYPYAPKAFSVFAIY
jgi:hypothetical protein